jgi:hypothetical protein
MDLACRVLEYFLVKTTSNPLRSIVTWAAGSNDGYHVGPAGGAIRNPKSPTMTMLSAPELTPYYPSISNEIAVIIMLNRETLARGALFESER